MTPTTAERRGEIGAAEALRTVRSNTAPGLVPVGIPEDEETRRHWRNGWNRVIARGKGEEALHVPVA